MIHHNKYHIAERDFDNYLNSIVKTFNGILKYEYYYRTRRVFKGIEMINYIQEKKRERNSDIHFFKIYSLEGLQPQKMLLVTALVLIWPASASRGVK